MTGPFESAALELRLHGLAPLPLGGEDGKKPLVSFAKWTHPPSEAYLERMMTRFGGENIGIVCGPSKVTVLDCDDANQADDLISRFGPTPLQAVTPRGGRHFFYRSAGEGCLNLRGEGLAADLKGRGGIIVVPPSVRLSGTFAGRSYRLLTGTWNDLHNLPTIWPGALPDRARDRDARPIGTGSPAAAVNGQRNDWLFRRLLRDVRGCDTFDDLLDVAQWRNQSFPEPLPVDEVAKVAASAWKLEEEGRNWCGGPAHVVVGSEEAAALFAELDALALLMLLRLAHGARPGQPFAVSPKAMAKHDLIPRWQPRRYMRARNWLVDSGFLVKLHHGGARTGDASQFALTGYGCISSTQYNINTSSPEPFASFFKASPENRGQRAEAAN